MKDLSEVYSRVVKAGYIGSPSYPVLENELAELIIAQPKNAAIRNTPLFARAESLVETRIKSMKALDRRKKNVR